MATAGPTAGKRPAALAAFKSALREPNGIILVTGPTGSGKTTSLYAGLALLNDAGFTTVDHDRGHLRRRVRPLARRHGQSVRTAAHPSTPTGLPRWH